MKKVFVFKTNINTLREIRKMHLPFRLVNGILKYHVDLKDCDKVLRIETETLCPETIINLMIQNGFHCQELV